MSVNKVILVGHVGKDAEVRAISGDLSVANFSIATTERGYTKKDGTVIPDSTEWHNITAWRGLATFAEKWVKKGTQLYIEGKLKTRTWDDKDGTKRYATDILAEKIQFVGKREESAPAQQSAPSGVGKQPTGNEEDDLPFNQGSR